MYSRQKAEANQIIYQNQQTIQVYLPNAQDYRIKRFSEFSHWKCLVERFQCKKTMIFQILEGIVLFAKMILKGIVHQF